MWDKIAKIGIEAGKAYIANRGVEGAIEDAADNDFEDIPWVFTLDRYPFDIEFAEGEEPIENSVYAIDAENSALYHRIG